MISFPALPHDALSRVITVPPVPRGVRAVRQWARETLTRWRLTDVADAAESVVSELVANAIQHAQDGSSVAVLLMHTAGMLRIEVRDHDPLNLPVLKHPGPLDQRGHGLVLVEALTDRWDVRVTETGKAVWCQIAAAPRIRPRTAAQCEDEGPTR